MTKQVTDSERDQGTPTQPARFSIPGIDVPAALVAVFKERPLAIGEAAEEYDAILTAFTLAVHPTDVFDWAWAKDLADAYWETRRARRIRSRGLCVAEMNSRLKTLVHAINVWAGQDKANLIAAPICGGDRRTGRRIAKIDEFAVAHGIEPDLEKAGFEGYVQALSDLEIVDRMIATADARRDRVLREIDRRRDGAKRRRLMDFQARLLESEIDDHLKYLPRQLGDNVEESATEH